MRVKILIAAAALLMSILTAYAVSDRGADGLATPESFAAIDDVATRSAALFTELGKVLTNPRVWTRHTRGRCRFRRLIEISHRRRQRRRRQTPCLPIAVMCLTECWR